MILLISLLMIFGQAWMMTHLWYSFTPHWLSDVAVTVGGAAFRFAMQELRHQVSRRRLASIRRRLPNLMMRAMELGNKVKPSLYPDPQSTVADVLWELDADIAKKRAGLRLGPARLLFLLDSVSLSLVSVTVLQFVLFYAM